MKIQFVCQYYYPDNFLINEICEELVKNGHDVSVLTGLPDYATGNIPTKYKFFRNRKEIVNGVKVTRVPIIARKKSKLLRAINYISFYINSSLYARFHNFDCDLVFVYQLAPILMANAGIIIKNKIKKPLFLYCLDPWPDQLKVWGVKEDNIFYKLIHQYCKKAYNYADLIGISSKPFKEYLVKINTVDATKIIELPQHSNKIENKKIYNKNKEQVDIVYAGSIGIQQNLKCLLKAIANINTNKKYHFHICGDGTELENCKIMSKQLNIDNDVSFYGRIGKERLGDIYAIANAFVITLAPEKEIGFSANTIPARFQSYLSMGKPILASIDGETKRIIEENECGLVTNAGNVEGLAKILSDYIDNPDKYTACGKNAEDYCNQNYKKSIVIDKIEKNLFSLIINSR